MAGVAFAVEGDGVGFATESYAASALYTTLASLSGALWRIRWARSSLLRQPLTRLRGFVFVSHRGQSCHAHVTLSQIKRKDVDTWMTVSAASGNSAKAT